MDIKIKNTIPLTIVQNKKIKHLGLNQPKHIKAYLLESTKCC